MVELWLAELGMKCLLEPIRNLRILLGDGRSGYKMFGESARNLLMAWSAEKVSKLFLSTANESHQYKSEVKKFKVKHNQSYKTVYDRELAKFYLYSHLHAKPFLETKESLIKELREISNNLGIHAALLSSVRTDVYSWDRFLGFWQEEIATLLARLDTDQFFAS